MRKQHVWRVIVGVGLGLLAAGVAEAHPKIAQRAAEEQVAGRWIVVLRDDVKDVDTAADDLAARVRGQALLRFRYALKGFLLLRADAASPEDVAKDPRVLFIEPDGIATMFEPEPVDPKTFLTLPTTQAASTQQLPTGNDRVNAELNPNTGAGVGVAIIDTGIQLSHPDLKVAGNVSFVRFAWNANDDNGHGTHVAGIAGALENAIGVVGIAPLINLFAVKVLDRNGSGYWSDIVRGIDWVTQNAKTIAVANMSLGGGLANADDGNCGNTNFDSIHKAICRSVDAGVIYVVAAGNSAKDAKDFRPAAYNEVLTVSALADSNGTPNGGGPVTSFGRDDTFATFSNFGQDVDLIAPGVDIRSTWKGSTYKTISGTSMAAPHVTGAVALWVAHHGRPVTGNAKDPAVQSIIRDISEPVGPFIGDTDGVAEPMLNADTAALGGTGSSVCCPAP